jgi:hypothetical protein
MSRATGIFSQDDLRRKIASLEREVAEAKAAAERVTARTPAAPAADAPIAKPGPRDSEGGAQP